MNETFLLSLALACAPNVAPDTIVEIARQESAFHPFAVHVNGVHDPFQPPTDLGSALEVVNSAIAKGHSVDIGLMQVNINNLSHYQTSLLEAFDPCTNVRIGGAILSDFYGRALTRFGDEPTALLAALSAYNTGSFQRGFTNGYVQRYFPEPPNFMTTMPVMLNHDPLLLDAMGASPALDLPSIVTKGENNMSNEPSEDEDRETKKTFTNVDLDRIVYESQFKAVQVDPDIAEELGYFEEKAISEEDAEEALGEGLQ